jgi:preprotein translocase subunit SecD
MATVSNMRSSKMRRQIRRAKQDNVDHPLVSLLEAITACNSMARTRSSTGAASVAQKRKVSHVEVDDGHEAPSVTPTVASKRRKATSKKTKSQHSPSPIGAVTEEEVTSPVVEAEVKHASVEAAEAGGQQHEKTTTKSKAVKTGKAREKATTKTNVTSKASADAASHADGEAVPDGPRFWLMKAEPNTRIENGVDVKFGIDDLEAATEPEPWEGVRNYVARNNMMAMKKGELAFFYHSNCKVPGIAGIMEVVKESCVDGTCECS